MKNILLIPLLFLLSIVGFSQPLKFQYNGRLNPSAKKEKLHEASFISEIAPGLWRSLFINYADRYELNRQVQLDYSMGNYVYPQPESFIYPYETYNRLIDYESVTLSATINGKALTAQSTNDKLTPEQKNILTAADLGTDISIKVKFTFKNPTKENAGKVVEGETAVTVVPETEAEYPGGFKEVSAYFMENVINKLSESSASDNIRRAIVKFTVDEEGEIVNAKISKTSTDPKIDKMLLEAINNMPKWKPAENSQGIKVKQEFSIPFNNGEGC